MRIIDKLYDYIYVFIYSLIYGLLNESTAYSEIIYDYDKWGGLIELPILLFTYVFNGVVAYIVFLRKIKVGYFLYFDVSLISLSVFVVGCDAIYLLGGWAMFRYGYVGSLLFVIMGYLQRNNILTCHHDLLLFWLIFGLGFTLAVVILSWVVHYITVLTLQHIAKKAI